MLLPADPDEQLGCLLPQSRVRALGPDPLEQFARLVELPLPDEARREVVVDLEEDLPGAGEGFLALAAVGQVRHQPARFLPAAGAGVGEEQIDGEILALREQVVGPLQGGDRLGGGPLLQAAGVAEARPGFTVLRPQLDTALEGLAGAGEPGALVVGSGPLSPQELELGVAVVEIEAKAVPVGCDPLLRTRSFARISIRNSLDRVLIRRPFLSSARRD